MRTARKAGNSHGQRRGVRTRGAAGEVRRRHDIANGVRLAACCGLRSKPTAGTTAARVVFGRRAQTLRSLRRESSATCISSIFAKFRTAPFRTMANFKWWKSVNYGIEPRTDLNIMIGAGLHAGPDQENSIFRSNVPARDGSRRCIGPPNDSYRRLNS